MSRSGGVNNTLAIRRYEVAQADKTSAEIDRRATPHSALSPRHILQPLGELDSRTVELTDIAAITITRPRRLPLGSMGRWLIIAGVILFDLVGFWVAKIPPDWASTEASSELLLLFLAYGSLLEFVRHRTARYRAAQKFAAFGAVLASVRGSVLVSGFGAVRDSVRGVAVFGSALGSA